MIGWKLWCETRETLKQVPYFAVASTDLLHLLSEMHCISYLRCASSLHQVCLQIVGKEEYLEKVWTTWANFHHVWQHLCHNFPENPFGVNVLDFGVLLFCPVFSLAPSTIFSFSSFLFAADLWARCLIRTPPCVHVKRTFSLILHYRYFCWDSFLNWKYNYETL